MSPTVDLGIAHHFGGGVYAKETHVRAGQVLVQHKHEHGHLSVLASGMVEVLVDGARTVLAGPACVVIEAGKHHGIKALTDAVWFCIHATDCTDEAHVDQVLISEGSDVDDMHVIAEDLAR